MNERATPVSILVVDDRPDKLLALEAILEDLGERVVTARSGRDALRCLLQEDFAVVLLDVDMPGMDGFETAQLIRQRKRSQRTPIIFLTAHGDGLSAEKGYALGAVDYILTPVVPEILRTKVSVFADLFRKTEQVRQQAASLERRAAQMHALARASLSINAAPSLDDLLEAIAQGAREALSARQAMIAVEGIHGEGGARAALLDADGRTTRAARAPDLGGDWLVNRVREAGGGVVRVDGRGQGPRPYAATAEHATILAAPLLAADGRLVGVIETLSDEPAVGGANDDEATLLMYSRLASVALQNLVHAAERESSRLKDDFLATLSHELRTPLTAILGWTRLLRDGPLEAARVAHGLLVIERNVNAQNRLIEDLLDVSRIATGKMLIERRSLRLSTLVEATLEALRPAATSKGITLGLSIESDQDSLEGDPDRLRQVATNLLSNAIKFTPRGGRVEMRLRRAGAELELVVRDTGEGIHPNFLPFVFDRFRQGDSSSRRSQGGLGIGLAVVRHIVTMHGGTVTAHSDGLRHGSTFTVRLPAGLPPPPPPAPLAELRAPGPDLHGLSVLVIEDDPDTRELLRRILADHQAEVRVAASVREAMALLDGSRPDVLVSDIAMPGEDGYDFIHLLRRRPPELGGAIPALALTAHARAEDQARALAAGFQRHASKPIEPIELIRAVAGLRGNMAACGQGSG